MVLVLHSPGFSRSRFFIFQVQGPGPGFRRSLIKYPYIMDLKVDLFTSTKRLFQTFKPIFNIDSIYHKKIELKVNLLCKSLYPVGIQSRKITKKKKMQTKKKFHIPIFFKHWEWKNGSPTIRQKNKYQNKARQPFPKSEYLLPPLCSFYGKLGVLSCLVTPVLGLSLLPSTFSSLYHLHSNVTIILSERESFSHWEGE